MAQKRSKNEGRSKAAQARRQSKNAPASPPTAARNLEESLSEQLDRFWKSERGRRIHEIRQKYGEDKLTKWPGEEVEDLEEVI